MDCRAGDRRLAGSGSRKRGPDRVAHAFWAYLGTWLAYASQCAIPIPALFESKVRRSCVSALNRHGTRDRIATAECSSSAEDALARYARAHLRHTTAALALCRGPRSFHFSPSPAAQPVSRAGLASCASWHPLPALVGRGCQGTPFDSATQVRYRSLGGAMVSARVV